MHFEERANRGEERRRIGDMRRVCQTGNVFELGQDGHEE